jgi:hypothetical protein
VGFCLQLLEIAPLELEYASGGNLLHALLEMRSPEVTAGV